MAKISEYEFIVYTDSNNLSFKLTSNDPMFLEFQSQLHDSGCDFVKVPSYLNKDGIVFIPKRIIVEVEMNYLGEKDVPDEKGIAYLEKRFLDECPARICNALNEYFSRTFAHIWTLYDVLEIDIDEFSKIRRIGIGSIVELKRLIDKYKQLV